MHELHSEIIPIKPNEVYEDNVANLMSKMKLEEPPLYYYGQKIK